MRDCEFRSNELLKQILIMVVYKAKKERPETFINLGQSSINFWVYFWIRFSVAFIYLHKKWNKKFKVLIDN